MLRDRADGSEDGLADLYLEGTDQHRGWFHSSMLQACGTHGPRALSRGADPRVHAGREGHEDVQVARQYDRAGQVVKQYGADILRLWVAQTDYTNDQRIGPEILKGVADSYRRLRNTMRFMLGQLSHFSDADRVAAEDMPELERWVLHRLPSWITGARRVRRL